MPIVRIDNPQVYVGMPFDKAKADIIDHGYECRLVWADGHTKHANYKPDYDPLRVNLHTEKGTVTKASIG